jgi:translocation and assembly module TamB
VDLPVLGVFEPDLLADGRSTIDAVIRGNLARPQITGRMDLADASFYLRDVPNGLDKTTGTIRFDRTRATIEKLTAQTGGGELTLGGFIGFGGDELVYRLQASAQRVRVRYPEAVSTTFNSTLSLTGTTSRRLLAGTVTVTRMGITPRTDIGSLLAESGRSATPVSTPNPFLRGMQLDVHVETSPDAEFQTSLTRDIQPEADLRLRGTASRPVVLGRISVNQGEIQFFGTQYTITRGEVSFFNPVKIEPVLSLDLETRVRGITVTINFTGPIDKLNMNYRSDPPLQSTEIIALLTVGRAPGTTPTAASSANPSQGFLTAGSNSLLGQAVAAPLTGRLQRLLGVSRLKIDPELTGVTNTPQARVTFEQQLSREITLTYTTNLNRTQQQIVRLQWDFSKDFSLLAVRDENGIFGVDFLYRRRFK